MYPVHAGVFQGCPLSATIFVMALNIFLEYAHSLNISQFSSRAAADDLGGVLRSILSLSLVFTAFQILYKISGLQTNPAKCILIP
jgi:hypothetical protein